MQMDIGFTSHARQRQQQRAIPDLVVSLIHSEGSICASHDGSEIRFVDKAARRRIQRAIGGDRAYALLERWLGQTYLVVAPDGSIITTGHRSRRIRRR
jgi:hypothetical protein